METKTTIVSISLEDLVSLFSTALYGSSMFGADYDVEDYKKLKDKNEIDCFEIKMAKILLNGGSVLISDLYAEDEDEFFGTLPHKWCEDQECMDYTVTLDDIKNGLQNCLDGTFHKNEFYDSEAEYLSKCMHNLMHDNGDLDLYEAQNILQVIIFGQMIYG